MRSKYYYLLLINSIITHFILFVPNIVIKEDVYGGIMAHSIGFVISSMNAYFLLYVFNSFEGLTLVEIDHILFGKTIGQIISFIIICFQFALGLLVFRGLVEIVQEYMIPDTPPWLIALCIVISIGITLKNTSRTYISFIGFLTWIIIPWIIVQNLITLREVKMTYVRGMLTRGFTLPSFSSIALCSFFYGEFFHLSLFNSVLEKKSLKNTILVFLLVSLPIGFLSILVPIGVWGPKAVVNLHFIWVATADTVTIDLFFIERVLFILLPLFFLLLITEVFNYVFVAYGLMKKMRVGKTGNRIVLLAILTFYIFAARIYGNVEELFRLGKNALVVWFVFSNGVTLVLFILTKVKEHKEV